MQWQRGRVLEKTLPPCHEGWAPLFQACGAWLRPLSFADGRDVGARWAGKVWMETPWVISVLKQLVAGVHLPSLLLLLLV